MNLDAVREQFEQGAFDYDGLIPRLIPRYREQHDVILQLIPSETNANIKILDLGAGTGILSAVLLSAFPQAKVLAFDLAQNMLKTCQTNLSAFRERLTLQQGNFAEDDFGSGYDLVVSGLAIHHLDSAGKQQLFHKLFHSMNPGGILLIRDIVTGATPRLTEQYEQLWRQYMKANGEDDAAWFQKYLEEDIPSSVEEQTKWLAEAGFADAGCHWRYLNFAIFGGVIPGRMPSAECIVFENYQKIKLVKNRTPNTFSFPDAEPNYVVFNGAPSRSNSRVKPFIFCDMNNCQ